MTSPEHDTALIAPDRVGYQSLAFIGSMFGLGGVAVALYAERQGSPDAACMIMGGASSAVTGASAFLFHWFGRD